MLQLLAWHRAEAWKPGKIKSRVGCRAQSRGRYIKNGGECSQTICLPVVGMAPGPLLPSELCSPPLRASSTGTSPLQAKRRGRGRGRQIARDGGEKRQREGPPTSFEGSPHPSCRQLEVW